MKSIDISKLSGDDLFAALQSGSKLVCKTPPKTLDRLAPARTSAWRWQDTDLVLIETHVDCCGCSRRYTYPNDTLFLRRKAANGAVHYTALEGQVDDPEARFAELECVVEYRHEEVKVCSACWDIAHIIERARCPKPVAEPAPKADLPAELPETDIDLELPADEPTVSLADLFQ